MKDRKRTAPQKLSIYEALHSLNRSFAQVLVDLRRFEAFPFFRRSTLHALAVIVEETQAWANFEIADVMHELELADWTRFSKLHRQWEKSHRDPNDVLLEAEKLQHKTTRGKARRLRT